MSVNFELAKFEQAIYNKKDIINCNLPEICFVGKSNVGKSSLINKLINRKKLARVSQKPGKTVSVNFYNVKDFRLVDLPGYGYSKASLQETERFSDLTDYYFKNNRDIKLVFLLLDVRHKIGDNDNLMINYLKSLNVNFAVILTKCDKLNKTQSLNAMEYFKNIFTNSVPIFMFSALSGQGANEIKKAIEGAIK